MKPLHLLRPSLTLFFLAACAAVATSTAQPAATESTVVLDPFTVPSSGLNEGYRTQSSASGLGFSVALDKVPLPISVLTGSFLADTGSFKVEDALRFVSGVANSDRTSARESYIIRGFATRNLLRDGEPFNTATDSALIDRVEVIKGPAAIVYGTSDPAGLVNVIQKSPTFRRETILRATYAEDGTYRGLIDFNQPFAARGELRAAGRLILSHSHDGFPRPYEFRRRTLIAPSLHFEYGRNTVLDARYNYAKEEGRLNRIQTPWDNRNEGASIFARGFVPLTRDFTFVTPHDDWNHRDQGLNLRLVQHLGARTTAQLSFVQSQVDGDHYFNIGNGRIGANAQGQWIAGANRMVTETRRTDHRGISLKLLHELTFGKTTHKLSLGIRDNRDTEYGYAYFDSRVTANPLVVIADASGPKKVLFPGAPRSVFSLSDPFATIITGVAANTNPDPVRVSSAYLTDYVTLLDGRLNLLLGVHHIDIKTQKKTATSPQFGAIYELVKGYSVYALQSDSYSPNGPASTVNPALGFNEPEKGSGREIGLKFSPLAGRLTGSLSAFEIKRENIVQFLGGVFTANNNIPSGEEKSQGLELDLLYTPAPGLSIMGAYAYTDAFISQNVITTDGNSPDENRDGVADSVGLPKEGVAKHDIRMWVSYAFADGTPLRGLSLGGGYTWRQGPIQQFPTYIHRFIQQVEDPERLDLFVGYATKFASRPLTLRLNWQNATDADYRDRRGYFVPRSTLQFTAETRF
jgi:iron complex outermembrane receptor protein